MDKRFIGLDISKSSFQVHISDSRGHQICQRRLTRSKVRSFFQALEPGVVGIEACATSNFWARELGSLGHEVHLLPATHVRAFRRGNKTDANDAAAICDALRHPGIERVAPATPEQQSWQMLHRVRQRLVHDRTAILNQARAFLAEFGIACAMGPAHARKAMQQALAAEPGALPPEALWALAELQQQLTQTEAHLAAFGARIEALAKAVPAARQLLTIPGIGPLAASALVASVGNVRRYRSARHFASSLGLTPAEFSTGGRQRLRGITKRGDNYLRALFVHGARAVLQFIDRHNDRLARWAQQLLRTKPRNVVAVALANKIARIVWAVSVHEQPYARFAADSA